MQHTLSARSDAFVTPRVGLTAPAGQSMVSAGSCAEAACAACVRSGPPRFGCRAARMRLPPANPQGLSSTDMFRRTWL